MNIREHDKSTSCYFERHNENYRKTSFNVDKSFQKCCRFQTHSIK